VRVKPSLSGVNRGVEQRQKGLLIEYLYPAFWALASFEPGLAPATT